MVFKAPFVGYNKLYVSALDDKGYYSTWHVLRTLEVVP
jgi:hypothetical protein